MASGVVDFRRLLIEQLQARRHQECSLSVFESLKFEVIHTARVLGPGGGLADPPTRATGYGWVDQRDADANRLDRLRLALQRHDGLLSRILSSRGDQYRVVFTGSDRTVWVLSEGSEEEVRQVVCDVKRNASDAAAIEWYILSRRWVQRYRAVEASREVMGVVGEFKTVCDSAVSAEAMWALFQEIRPLRGTDPFDIMGICRDPFFLALAALLAAYVENQMALPGAETYALVRRIERILPELDPHEQRLASMLLGALPVKAAQSGCA